MLQRAEQGAQGWPCVLCHPSLSGVTAALLFPPAKALPKPRLPVLPLGRGWGWEVPAPGLSCVHICPPTWQVQAGFVEWGPAPEPISIASAAPVLTPPAPFLLQTPSCRSCVLPVFWLTVFRQSLQDSTGAPEAVQSLVSSQFLQSWMFHKYPQATPL